MSVKVTGAEFKRFYADPAWWSEDGSVYHDDATMLVNGAETDFDFDPATVSDDSTITVSGGVVFGVKGEPSLETYFKRWQRQQNTVVLVIEASRATADAIKEAVKAAGGKVL